MSLRVPVPWGEPKAQVVSGLNRPRGWRHDNDDRIALQDFDALFGEPEIEASYKAPPVALAGRKAVAKELPPALAQWAIGKTARAADAPRGARSLVTSLPAALLSFLEGAAPDFLAWANTRGIKLKPRPEQLVPQDPFATRSKVAAIDVETQPWADIVPPALLEWAVQRGIKRIPVERLAPLDPFKAGTKVIALTDRRQLATALKRGDWHQVPPSLAKWAVERGIKKAEPPPPRRAAVYGFEKRQQIFEALARGEWCLVYELDDEFLPRRLRQWLLECKVTLIRYIGGGRVSGVPVNGYVTEDGLVFYVAEDNSTFYVQET